MTSILPQGNAPQMKCQPNPRQTLPVYGAHGEIVQFGGDSYVYDSAGRHVSTSSVSNTVSYVRDASGGIVSRTDTAAGSTVRYSGGAVLSTANVVQERTLALPGGGVLTKRAGGDVWSLPNVHGDVAATTDAAGVKTSGTFNYDPYGVALSGVPDNSAGNWDFGWVGQHQKGFEHAVGLTAVIEMGARVYSPVTGRFLSTDPIEGGSANDYDYTNADPVNSFDLTGRDPRAQIHRSCIHQYSDFYEGCERTMLARDGCNAGPVPGESNLWWRKLHNICAPKAGESLPVLASFYF